MRDDLRLYDEANFTLRAEALDTLDLHGAGDPHAERLRARLEEIDAALLAGLRRDIRTGACRGADLLRAIRRYVPPQEMSEGRYDHLDAFLSGLLLDRPLPDATRPLEAGMVFYQRTPSRVALGVIAQLTPDDVFYDIGSGLGEVVILANLLRGTTAKGIEREPAYCDYARACASDLNVDAEFLNVDAREADFSDGTAFFLYTPFTGRILEQVLDRLQAATAGRTATIFTYGPCTPEVAQQTWLRRVETAHELAAFHGRVQM
ncbi:MAG TPA: class I SAM-dependent methyltransferase [Thermoanaerobaculia bacterium]